MLWAKWLNQKWRAAVNLTMQKMFSLFEACCHTPGLNIYLVMVFHVLKYDKSVWLLVVISNSEKQRLTSGKLWVFLSQKKKKIKPKSLLSWSVLGKASKCFQQQNWKSGFDNSYNYFKWKKKNPQEKYKAFLEQLLYALCTSAIWLLFLKKRKKKIRLVPSTDHHRKD